MKKTNFILCLTLLSCNRGNESSSGSDTEDIVSTTEEERLTTLIVGGSGDSSSLEEGSFGQDGSTSLALDSTTFDQTTNTVTTGTSSTSNDDVMMTTYLGDDTLTPTTYLGDDTLTPTSSEEGGSSTTDDCVGNTNTDPYEACFHACELKASCLKTDPSVCQTECDVFTRTYVNTFCFPKYIELYECVGQIDCVQLFDMIWEIDNPCLNEEESLELCKNGDLLPCSER